MEFNEMSYIFDGSISEDGHIKIFIPKLSEIQEGSGQATLEVIAESTFFEPWKSDFILKNKRSVKVNEVSVNTESSKIVIENIVADVEEEKEVIQEKELIKETPKRIFKEDCSDRNKKFIRKALSKYKALDKGQKVFIGEQLNDFDPNEEIKEWGSSVFEDPSKDYARYCMLNLQNGLIGSSTLKGN